MSERVMHCPEAREAFSAFLDGRVPPEQSWAISEHLGSCSTCTAEVRQLRLLRATLRNSPRRMPPEQLTASLRVLASRERLRSQVRSSWSARRDYMWANFQLWRDNLMRPFALPVTGGIFSAVILFGLLTPAFMPFVRPSSHDIPIGLTTEPTVKTTAPVAFDSDNVTVELTIDEQGRLVDYKIPTEVLHNPNLRRSVENNLIFMRFTPATRLGLPTSSTIRISFPFSRIDVKG